MLRQLVLAASVLASGCANLQGAFAPAPNPWPIPHESRVRRDGRLLRVYGASLKNRAEAEADAARALEAWLWTIDLGDLGDDLEGRQAVIAAVLASPQAKPVPSPVPEKSGFSSVIELDLPELQKKLGTHYE
jgi:hypothetical protein